MATKAEPKETSERYIQRQVVTFLRSKGWYVQVFSGSIKMAPGLSGHPDILAMKKYYNVVYIFYVECKAKGGRLRPSQEKWLKRAKDVVLGGTNVKYVVAEATKFDPFIMKYYEEVGWMK